MARTRARFVRPTRFGDDVTVKSAVTFGRASFEIAHHVTLNGSDARCALERSEARVWAAHSSRTNPAATTRRPLPQAVRAKFGA